MNITQHFKVSDKLLIVYDETKEESFKQLIGNIENVHHTIKSSELLAVPSFQNEYLDSIICTLPEDKYTVNVILQFIKFLKPGGKLVLYNIHNPTKVKFDLTINGFMKVTTNNENVIAIKPIFKTGSSAKLNLLKKNAPAVWKLNDMMDDDVETIDPDNLLDEDDLKKPDPSSLKVCSTTGKRKACKDCSCGLADELAAEAKAGKVIDTEGTPKSSCGSCYLGDAFRCATCPYLGMPAFKPGEKIQLIDNQLEPDI